MITRFAGESRFAALCMSTAVCLAYSVMACGTVIVDASTNIPLPKASVFDKKGNLIGICSDVGELPYVARSSYPISIRYMGYATSTVDKPGQDKVFLKEMAYDLPEMTVNSRDHQVLHLTGYVREYSTLSTYTDTVLLFREKTVDFMIPAKNIKNYKGWSLPRVLASRSYYHLTNAVGLDSVSNHFNQHFSWSDWVGVFNSRVIPADMRDDTAATHVDYGKYSPSVIWRRTDDNIVLDVDILADRKNREFVPAFSGFVDNRVDCSRFTLKYIFSGVYGHEVFANSLMGMSFNIESNGRGRNLNRHLQTQDPVYINTYAELYITDREYLTVHDAYKREKKPPHSEEIGINPPPEAPELQPAILSLVERVDNFDYDTPRLDKQPDRRLGTASKFATDKPDGLFKRLFKVFKHERKRQ